MQTTGRATTIIIRIPGMLRADSGGSSELVVEARTLREALDVLERRYPALHRNICDETGQVRRHVNLFVNTQHMRDRDGLDTPLSPGDVVLVLPAVSGG